MTYDNNEGPVYSYLGAKENSQCAAYCASQGYYSMCSWTPTITGACIDDEGVDCFSGVNPMGGYCCCNQ